MRRNGWLAFSLLSLALLPAPPAAANEPSSRNPSLEPFYRELRSLFHRYYPQVTSHALGDDIHFEHDTRVYVVHEPLKTGEWQDPVEERGPKRGGILCDIELRKGRYLGAAVVPQTFDKRYFKLLVMAPYSAEHDAHVYTHLSFPDDVNVDFLKQFTALVDDFAKYLKPTE